MRISRSSFRLEELLMGDPAKRLLWTFIVWISVIVALAIALDWWLAQA